MSRSRILLTGDDGYQSLGTRLLAHVLREKFDLTIAGTITQQSAVGGKISLKDGFKWGSAEVDGTPAFWVEGTPVDAMELMACYDIPSFDFVISGVNWGANLGGAVYSSGTFNAAVAAIVRGTARQAVAISWDLPPEFYTMHHDKKHSLEEYLQYPGHTIKELLTQCIDEKLWGAQLLNINLPQQPAQHVRVTKLLEDVRQIYDYSGKEFGKEGRFTFDGADRVFKNDIDQVYDVRALTDGYISLTPCQVDLVQPKLYQSLQKVQFKIK
ncbi:hypothetical protein H3C66_02285 [Patescibacteria group bacterium]|nr:hypothetical protein [Patescibacteria group bacterium]